MSFEVSRKYFLNVKFIYLLFLGGGSGIFFPKIKVSLTPLTLIRRDIVDLNQFNFQDMSTTDAENLVFFHNGVMFLIVAVTIFVGLILLFSVKNNFYHKNLIHGKVIEILWTIAPAIAMVIVVIPSLGHLYHCDEGLDPLLAIKITAHQ